MQSTGEIAPNWGAAMPPPTSAEPRLVFCSVALVLPEELEAKLDLAATCRGRGNGAGGARDARWILGGRRREDDQVGRIEVGSVEQIEDFGAKLQREAFTKLRVFEDAEVPGAEAGTNISVAAEVAGESALGRRGDERCGIEILLGVAGDDFAGEIGIEEGAHGVAGIAGVRGVVAELRRDRESGLGSDDARERPSTDQAAGPAFITAPELPAATERQLVENVDHPDVADVEGGKSFVGGEIERIRNQAGRVVGSGLIERVAVIERFGEGVGAAQDQAVAETAANIDLESVVTADAFGEPGPGVGDGGVGFGSAGRNVIGSGGDGRSSERRADQEADVRAVRCRSGQRRVPSWENSGAGRRRADDALGFIGVHADELVVAVRADVAD